MRSVMRSSVFTLGAVVALGVGVGCSPKNPPDRQPPPRVEVPPRLGEPPVREREEIKPLPGQSRGDDFPPPPFDDVPLVGQRTPEQKAFVDAYEAVGRPRMMVFVDAAPGSGGRDELAVEDIDYDSMEKILTDWFAADGQVELLSSAENRRPAEDRGNAPRSTTASAPPVRGGADVFIRVRAQQTRQTRDEAAVRLVGEAVNAEDGRSIGRAVVDVPPPLDKPQLNKYTRFLGRRLMDQMTGTWRAMASDRGQEREQDRDARRRLRERSSDRAPRPADAPPQDTRRLDPRRDDSPPQDRPIVTPPPGAHVAPTTRPSSVPDAGPDNRPDEPSRPADPPAADPE